MTEVLLSIQQIATTQTVLADTAEELEDHARNMVKTHFRNRTVSTVSVTVEGREVKANQPVGHRLTWEFDVPPDMRE